MTSLTDNDHAPVAVNNRFEKITDRDKTMPVEKFLSTKLSNFEPSHKSKIDEYRATLEEAFVLQNAVDQSLSTLETPSIFCKRKLNMMMRTKYPSWVTAKHKIKLKPKTSSHEADYSITLLQAAMLNFTDTEAAADYYSSDSEIVFSPGDLSDDDIPKEKITAEEFSALSRSLDLGNEYQKMIEEKFNTAQARADAVQLAMLNLKLAAYTKFFSKDIDEETWSTLKNLTDKKVDIANGSVPEQERILFYSVQLLGKYDTNTVMLIVSKNDPTKNQYILYVPNDRGPGFYVYNTPEDFRRKFEYLLQHDTPLPKFLASQMNLVDQAACLAELKELQKAKNTGTVDRKERSVSTIDLSGREYVTLTNLKAENLFAHISTLNLNTFITDTKRIAVPVNEVNLPTHANRRAHSHLHPRPPVSEQLTYSFRTRLRSSPVEALLSELFTGVEDWTVEEKKAGLLQLLDLKELRNQQPPSSTAEDEENADALTRLPDYFNAFELVGDRENECFLLWKRDLAGYRQRDVVASRLKNSGQPYEGGAQILLFNSRYFIWIKDSAYEVKPSLLDWRVVHPFNKSAYRPSVMYRGWELAK
ncbi:hypothetical protein PS732_01192 [Pseudomonas fluorescens]|uniref:UvrC family homology region profile domain-containing protein n=1 Tax=Pseudomonas fluorescens TaxID=294 RepID=A0ABD7VCP2_PSEFL|nr:DUF6543 domain-containing protein [Pseudomonas fluorescens]VVO68365.1 hypothetical protein PS732_01192 [Pseudomonas fluorescens]